MKLQDFGLYAGIVLVFISLLPFFFGDHAFR